MGYTTEFRGCVTLDKPLDEELNKYLDDFLKTRRMMRDVEKIKEMDADWQKHCYRGELGREGEFYYDTTTEFGDAMDDSVIDYNVPPYTQPGLWCDWQIVDNTHIIWDGAEKFYNYVEWMEYIINNFLAPNGYVANGSIEWHGEDMDDIGTIIVEDNVVTVRNLG